MSGLDELTKRLRLLKKKIRQIDELVASKAAGGLLNSDQEAKIKTKPDLIKQQKVLTEQIDKLREAEPKPEPIPVIPKAESFDEITPASPSPKKQTKLPDEEWGGGGASGWRVDGVRAVEDEWHVVGKQPEDKSAKKAEEDKSGKKSAEKDSQKTKEAKKAVHEGAHAQDRPAQHAQRAEQKTTPAPAPAPAPKKDVEKPFRKGWRGGCFAERRIDAAHRSAVTCVFVVPGRGRVVTGGLDNLCKEWNLSSGAMIRSHGGHTKAIHGVWGDGEHTVSASDDGTVRYWSVSDGKVVRNMYLFAPVKCMTVDGDKLVTGHSDGTVRVYDARVDGSDNPKITLRGHQGSVTSVCVCNGGANVVSTAKDATVRVWDLVKGLELHKLHEPQDLADEVSPFAASWLHAERKILSTHDDGECRIWEFPYSKCVKRVVPDDDAEEEPVMLLSHLTGGDSTSTPGVVALSAAQCIKGYDLATLAHTYTLHPSNLDSISCMHGGADFAAVGSYEGCVVILEVLDERKVDAKKGAQVVPTTIPSQGSARAAAASAQAAQHKGGGGGAQTNPAAQSKASGAAAKGVGAKKDMAGQVGKQSPPADQASLRGLSQNAKLQGLLRLVGALVFAVIAILLAFPSQTWTRSS